MAFNTIIDVVVVAIAVAPVLPRISTNSPVRPRWAGGIRVKVLVGTS